MSKNHDEESLGKDEQAEFDELMNACKQKLVTLDANFEDVVGKMNEIHTFVQYRKQQHDKIIEMTQRYPVCTSDIVKLNVGGTLFSTLKSTLNQRIKKAEGVDEFHDPNLLQMLVSGFMKPAFDENKAIFIDRDPQYFRYIIDYLRTVKADQQFNLPELNSWDLNKLRTEAEYYKLGGLLYLFELNHKFDDCKILTPVQLKELATLCEFQNNQKWKLLYSAIQHGFGSDAFHRQCDGISNTLTIVKTTNNYIFGGFVSVAWNSTGNYYNDSNAFIFTLINHESRPLKLKHVNVSNSIYCNSTYGPTFGGGHDFHISSNSKSNSDSYSRLGSSYATGNSPNPTSLLAGSTNFQVKEIEVFQKL